MLRYLLLVLLIATYGCSENTPSRSQGSASHSQKAQKKTAGFNPDKNAYFGDLHIHTSWSFDAFIYNVRTGPDDAYRFGKGEAIDHVSGEKIQMDRPLDFMAVTDHAEYMGVMKQMIDPNHPYFQLPIADSIRSQDRTMSKTAFNRIGISLAGSNPLPELLDRDQFRSTWQSIVQAADDHYEPGTFTTFYGYEWTSAPAQINSEPTYARNMHRNVIFKGPKVPEVPFTAFDSQNPEELWEWMDGQREQGVELLAIPHNMNMSDGWMYALNTYEGKALSREYANNRTRNEPIHEVAQIKGTSMTHPSLSPNDEFADFELYEYTFSTGQPPPSQADGSYVRQALRNGLAQDQVLGANPFKFGFIGSSDGHNSATAVEEDNYFGKIGNVDATPEARVGKKQLGERGRYRSAAGLAGVWAEENTRESLFEAMERREVFATSGPRIQVRLFGAWDMEENILENDNWVELAYQSGVPMGGDLPHSTDTKVPFFIIWANKDPEGANLDRVQLIKLFIDENGDTHEKIYNVAWAGDRKVNALGKLPAVGNTVNVADASYTNDIGGINLQTVWTDKDFNPNHPTIYYLRVLEIPTPRWNVYDAKALGIAPFEDRPTSIQERAWSSPIWYNP